MLNAKRTLLTALIVLSTSLVSQPANAFFGMFASMFGGWGWGWGGGWGWGWDGWGYGYPGYWGYRYPGYWAYPYRGLYAYPYAYTLPHYGYPVVTAPSTAPSSSAEK